MPMSPDPASNEPSAAEAQLLADCYALLLANIRQNRARRLAQSVPSSIASRPTDRGVGLRLDDAESPVGEARGQAPFVVEQNAEG
jgi:hypothetical protein